MPGTPPPKSVVMTVTMEVHPSLTCFYVMHTPKELYDLLPWTSIRITNDAPVQTVTFYKEFKLSVKRKKYVFTFYYARNKVEK